MDINEKIIQVLKELSASESIEEASNLAMDLGLDSLGLVTLLVMIEDSFQIQLDESDMNPFALQTVGDVIRLTRKYVDDRDE